MRITTLAALAAFVLTTGQLDGFTAGYQTSPGAPFVQTPVKGKNIVKAKGASCQCGQGAVVKGKR
jgi:hypothetical protein